MLGTVSQPQLYPPPYMLSRYARTELLIWMLRSQYKRKQNMVELQLLKGKQKIGLKLDLIKDGMPWLTEIQVSDPHRFAERLVEGLRECYGDTEYAREAVALVQTTFYVSDDLCECVTKTTENMMLAFGIRPVILTDVQVIADRDPDACKYLHKMFMAAGVTKYFQGRASMESYFDQDKFPTIELGCQKYDAVPPPDGEVSILNYVAKYGARAAREIVQANKTLIESF